MITINIVERYCTSIITTFKDVIFTYENNIDIIKRCEDEQMDLEHEIELASPKNAREGYKLYKELREVRLRRRKAKDENQLLHELYNYLKKNLDFNNKMKQIQGNTAKIYEQQHTKTYKPRVRQDLTCTDQTCMAYNPFEELLENATYEQLRQYRNYLASLKKTDQVMKGQQSCYTLDEKPSISVPMKKTRH